MGYVLITGASKGIGKALAGEFANQGHSLILTARSKELLEALADQLRKQFKIEVHLIAADLSKAGGSDEIFQFCQTNGFKLDVLVNNAGFGLWDAFDKQPVESWEEMLQVNVTSPQRLMSLFLPQLKQEKKSFILNVASVASYQPIPWMSVYGATKSYLVALSRGLRVELAGTNVKVCCLCPGGVHTEFSARAGNEAIVNQTKLFHMTAEKIARITVRKMKNGRAEFVPGWYNQFAVLLTKFIPKAWAIASAGKLFRKVY
jgi:uncharacterized protein